MSESERTSQQTQTEKAESTIESVGDQPAAVETDDAGVALVPSTGAGMPPTAQAFFAVINANGTRSRGFGVVSSARLGVGQYQVIFSHSLVGSAFVGTIGLASFSGVSPSGQIAVVGRAGNPNGVFVQTFAANGVAADRGFHLAVFS